MGTDELPYTDVAVVLITRNEEQAIAKVLGDVRTALPGAALYVVDDSDDRTPEIARTMGAQVAEGPRSGFGPAMHQALLTPTEPIVATIDADDTYPANRFPDLIDAIRDGYDVAGTDRLAGRPEAMPRANYLGNRALSLLATARARTRVCDVHSGQRAYRRDVLHDIEWRYGADAFPIDLIFIPALLGLRVVEFPIEYRDRVGETTLDRWSSGKASLQRLTRPRKSIRESVASRAATT